MARPQRPVRSSSWLAAPLGAVASLLANPLELVELAQGGISVADTLQRLVLLPPDPKTVLKGPLGVSKRAAWSEIVPLKNIKAAGARHGATINDILITAVAGALRDYLEERGEPVDEFEIRAAVPVNLRPIERGLELGNSFGLVFVPLPISIADPFRRLAELKVRMDGIKASSEAIVSFGVLTAIGIVPRQLHPPAIEFFGSKASVVMTNVPGPREPLYLAGPADRQLHVLGSHVRPPGPGRQHPELRRGRDGRRGGGRRAGPRPGPDRGRLRTRAEGPYDARVPATRGESW